jgi:[acyl-carrier-protein] S-malonyltransferase
VSNWAFIFPGQGAQEAGMGRALAEAFPQALDVWSQAERTLGIPLRELAWQGAPEALARTDLTQPALLTAEIAVLRVVESRGVTACATAGHSLGEYAALVAAGALSFVDALKIVSIRGKAMQAAAETADGGMAAVIGADEVALEALCAEIGNVAPANINAPGQIVVSGTNAALRVLEARGKEIRARRVLRLNVAGPFHSPAMVPAAEAVAEALKAVSIANPAVPVYANVTALPESGAAEIAGNLIAQVTGRVRWAETVRNLTASGVTRFVELGPGAVLAGLVKRIDADATVYSVGDPESLESFLKAVAG